MELTLGPTPPPLTWLCNAWAFVNVGEYVWAIHALVLSTFVAPSNETKGVLCLLHPYAKVDLPPFIDDFHLETKVILEKHFFLLWFVHHIFLLMAFWVWCMTFYNIILSQMILWVALTSFSKHVGIFLEVLFHL